MALVSKKIKEVKVEEKKRTVKDDLRELLEIKERIKELQNREKQIKQGLIEQFGVNFEGKFDDIRVSIKQITTNRIDTKQLKTKYPEIAAEVEKEVVITRLDIKRV